MSTKTITRATIQTKRRGSIYACRIHEIRDQWVKYEHSGGVEYLAWSEIERINEIREQEVPDDEG